MNNLSSKDKKRLDEIAKVLATITNESEKDQLVGAAKWAVICRTPRTPQKTA